MHQKHAAPTGQRCHPREAARPEARDVEWWFWHQNLGDRDVHGRYDNMVLFRFCNRISSGARLKGGPRISPLGTELAVMKYCEETLITTGLHSAVNLCEGF